MQDDSRQIVGLVAGRRVELRAGSAVGIPTKFARTSAPVRLRAGQRGAVEVRSWVRLAVAEIGMWSSVAMIEARIPWHGSALGEVRAGQVVALSKFAFVRLAWLRSASQVSVVV